MHPIQRCRRAIESKRGKEDLQSFGQPGGGIVRQEWTQRRQQKRNSRRPFGDRPPGQVGNDQAGGQVHHNLRQHDGPEVARSKEPEDPGQKSGISRQPRVGRQDRQLRVASLHLAVDSVLQPVGGEVGVNARVIRDRREIDEEK